jgi:hypothetical protein
MPQERSSIARRFATTFDVRSVMAVVAGILVLTATSFGIQASIAAVSGVASSSGARLPGMLLMIPAASPAV